MDKRAAFDKDISLHWHCEARHQFAIGDLRHTLSDQRHPLSDEDFRQMLEQAIRERRYSLQEYEALTGLNFESADEVAEDLHQLWRKLYGAGAERP